VESRDRLADTIFREEMRRLNAHLPKVRRTLKELLKEDSPSVSTVDGGRVVMKPAELGQLAAALPEELKERVRLPLVLLRRTELGPGTFTLMGDRAEEFALSRIVKGYTGSYDEFVRTQGKPQLFYKPEVSELMRKFHTLLVIGFGVPEQRE